jgi:hypothetical protein
MDTGTNARAKQRNITIEHKQNKKTTATATNNHCASGD